MTNFIYGFFIAIRKATTTIWLGLGSCTLYRTA